MVYDQKEYHRRYFQENKERLYRLRLEKVFCECGRMVSKTNMRVHKSRAIHARCMPTSCGWNNVFIVEKDFPLMSRINK